MLLAESRQSLRELLGLADTLGDLPQIIEDIDGCVVVALLAGVDQCVNARPGRLVIAGQSVESLLAGQCLPVRAPSLLFGTSGFGLPLALVADVRGGIQQFGHRAAEMGVAAEAVRLAAESTQQLHLDPHTMASGGAE